MAQHSASLHRTEGLTADSVQEGGKQGGVDCGNSQACSCILRKVGSQCSAKNGFKGGRQGPRVAVGEGEGYKEEGGMEGSGKQGVKSYR